MNGRGVLHGVGALVIFVGVAMLAPLGVALFYGQGDAGAFGLSTAVTVLSGAAILLLTRGAVENASVSIPVAPNDIAADSSNRIGFVCVRLFVPIIRLGRMDDEMRIHLSSFHNGDGLTIPDAFVGFFAAAFFDVSVHHFFAGGQYFLTVCGPRRPGG